MPLTSKELRRIKGEIVVASAADQVKGCVRRLERLDEEAGRLMDDKIRIYRELRAAGLDVVAIKLLIRHRRAQRHGHRLPDEAYAGVDLSLYEALMERNS